MRVPDKSISVTGAGGGIGEGIARRLAAEALSVRDFLIATGDIIPR